MLNWISRLWSCYRATWSYLIFGALTVVLNTALFLFFSWFMPTVTANSIAFVLSVLFAYWTNSTFVFRAKHTMHNFLQFIGMRIGTIIIDNLGMLALLHFGLEKLWAKMIVNVIIIILNYIFSKCFIFRNQEGEQK